MEALADTASSALQQFVEDCYKEYEQAQRELKEVDLLIQQSSGEVERLAQRNALVTNQLRQIEAALNTVPREDIREAYTTAQDAQQRLFTMRGQLEKLQADQRHLERYVGLLRRLLEVAGPQAGAREAQEEGPGAQLVIVRIIEAQERERQRLGRQMHDGPAQSLTNLILQAEICERLFNSDPERARVELVNLKNSVATTFRKIRDFIAELRPMMLDDLGLVPTLRQYVDSFAESSGIATTLTVTGKERRMVAHKEVTVFRVIQELLNNAREHAHATNIQVSLDLGDHLVRAAVEDNGRGFDISEALSSPVAGKLGLATLRERVEMLGGKMQFDSGLGRGTKISLEIPVR